MPQFCPLKQNVKKNYIIGRIQPKGKKKKTFSRQIFEIERKIIVIDITDYSPKNITLVSCSS
jgi:hypothetical protein